VLNGDAHYPWQASCLVQFRVSILPLSINASTALTLFYSVKVPRMFNWSGVSSWSPGAASLGSVAAASGRVDAAWPVLNASSSSSFVSCFARFTADVTGYDDAAWFPYSLKLAGAQVNTSCGGGGGSVALVTPLGDLLLSHAPLPLATPTRHMALLALLVLTDLPSEGE
jgi:hypothetical protein